MQLKPCPFCGETQVYVREEYRFAFTDIPTTYTCGCESDMCPAQPTVADIYTSEEEAIEAWNTRVERTCELNGTISCEWHTTSTTFYTHSLSCGHNVTTTEPEPPCYCEECGAKVVE